MRNVKTKWSERLEDAVSRMVGFRCGGCCCRRRWVTRRWQQTQSFHVTVTLSNNLFHFVSTVWSHTRQRASAQNSEEYMLSEDYMIVCLYVGLGFEHKKKTANKITRKYLKKNTNWKQTTNTIWDVFIFTRLYFDFFLLSFEITEIDTDGRTAFAFARNSYIYCVDISRLPGASTIWVCD